MIGEIPMNDLFFVRYQAKLMLVDSIDMPADVELAHRRLCDFIWAMDKCPEDNDSTLPEICRVKQADWVRVRGGLLMKGWSSKNGFFEHGGALKTLQEAKKEYETNQNRAKTASKARWSKTEPSSAKESSSNAQALPMESQLQSQSSTLSINRESRRFAPPSLEEVKLNGAKIGLSASECEKFHAYYQSNGWRVGRNPMKSWTAAMVHWKGNVRNPMVPDKPSIAPQVMRSMEQLVKCIGET